VSSPKALLASIAPLWLCGSMVWFAGVAWSAWHFHRLLRSAKPAPASLQDQTCRLAERLGLNWCPEVWLLPGAISPMIWTIGMAPRLVFPLRLLDRLDEKQRAALLLHELAHVRRHDHWVRFLEVLAVGLYWWLPVVWWARRELREVEEQCCDAWVVWASAGDGHAYALALIEAVAFVSRAPSPLPVGASGIGQVSHLRRRLTMIMSGNTPKTLSALGWLAVLCLGFILLPLTPAQAQQDIKKVIVADERDQEIQALRARIKELEAKRRAEQAARATEKAPPEVQEAMKAAAELKRMIGAKRAELDALEAKLKATVTIIEGYHRGQLGAKQVGDVLKQKVKVDVRDQAIKALDRIGELKELLIIKELDDLKGLDPKRLEELKKGIEVHIKDLDLKGMTVLDPKMAEELKHGIGNIVIQGLDLKGLKLDEKNLNGLKIKILEEVDAKKLEDAKKKLDKALQDQKTKSELQLKAAQEALRKAVDARFKQAEKGKILLEDVIVNVKPADKAKAEAAKQKLDKRAMQLEERLEMIMKEIQQLRQQLKEEKQRRDSTGERAK